MKEITIEITAYPELDTENILRKLRAIIADEGKTILQYTIKERVESC